MKIGFSTIYGDLYLKDKLFNNKSCNIGENLLMPNIRLKEELEKLGHEVHTIDEYSDNEYQVAVFFDIPVDSILTINKFVDYIKYFIKRKWKRDYLYKAVHFLDRENIILQINEPPTVAPQSYNKKYHKYFGKIITWNDELVDGEKYCKACIAQYWSGKILHYDYEKKKDFVMIAGNKKSVHNNELYSERRRVIDYFEENKTRQFDLYGFGWLSENITNYRGMVERKLDALSKYKYSFCYENIKDVSGYITEKIFDCFFAGVVPIYWGADNVEKYIPSDCYIDMHDFENLNELLEYIDSITKEQYEQYLNNVKRYLESEQFVQNFSVDKYISIMMKQINCEVN